jgi:hypothetical protein
MTTIADGSYLARILAHVEGRDLAEAFTQGATRVEAAVRRLGPSGLAKPWAPGKWTGRQVLAHLADAEIAIAFRARQVLTQQLHTMQTFDEAAWLGLYGDVDVEAALQAFLAARRWNLQLVRGLSPAQLERVGFHPERGEETVAVTLRALAGHTFNHVNQLEAL